LTHRDLDPLMGRVNEILQLTPDEHAQFIASRERDTDGASAQSPRLPAYDRANAQAEEIRASRTGRADPVAKPVGGSPATAEPTSAAKSQFPGLGDILETWIIAPLIFLLLLGDTGSIKRGLLSVVPNRLFEPALAVMADVDEALGNYVRGLFLECCALGLTVVVFITIVGVPFSWAIAIGILVAASNVVPYMGFAAALLGSLAYALLAEKITPLVPLVTTKTFAMWVVVAVALAELIKNIVYEPVVLGWRGQASSARGGRWRAGRRDPVRPGRNVSCDPEHHRRESARREQRPASQGLWAGLRGHGRHQDHRDLGTSVLKQGALNRIRTVFSLAIWPSYDVVL
jgi:AI-2E family transporter